MQKLCGLKFQLCVCVCVTSISVIFHLPPSTDIEYREKLNESINRISNTNSPVRLEGNFNLPYINWDVDFVTDKCNNRSIHEKLLDIENSHFLQQVVTKPTMLNNALDLFLTNNDSRQ